MKMKNLNTKSSQFTNVEDDDSMFKKRRGRPSKHIQQIKDDFDIIHNDITNCEDVDDIEALENDNLHSDPDEDDYTTQKYIEPKPLTTKEKKLKHYVDTKKLEESIAQYYKDSIITDDLALALYNIAHRVAYMPNFMNYSWREEMIGDGMIKEFTALKNKKYNPKYGRAFSYFTQIVFHSFCNRIKKENKAHEVLKEYQHEEYNKLMFEYGVNQNECKTSENDNDLDE